MKKITKEPVSVKIVSEEILTQGEKKGEKDVNVSLDGSKLCVTLHNTKVSFVYVTFPRDFSDDAYIYGDDFERGYGDLRFEQNRKDALYWYYIATDNGRHFAGGVKTLPNALCAWRVRPDCVELVCDLRSGTDPLEFDGTLELCELVFAEGDGDLHAFCHDFCKSLAVNARTVDRPVFGTNDWYCNYGNNSYDKIIRMAKFTTRCAKGLPYKPYVVVDDGWQINRHDGFIGGEWDTPNERFGDMAKLAKEITDMGAIPGLWFRPLQSKKNLPDECFTNKRDHLLDPSHPIVLKTVAEDIKRFYSWGFRVVKYDFVTIDVFGCWGNNMSRDNFADEYHFFDKTKTTAQIIKNFYKTMRDAAPDDLILLGCNAIGHLAVGYIDMQRTGDDTSGRDWSRTRKMGVNTLAFRMMQHKAFYESDADCVGLTKDISLERNKKWLDVLSKSSTPLFVSVHDEMQTDEVAELVAAAFKNSVKYREASKPVDLLETRTPKKWESEFAADEYDWE